MGISPEPHIPAHQPIVVCPSCGIHTAHVMRTFDRYECLRCATQHGIAPLRKVHHEDAPMWCPVCRAQAGSPFWAPTNGRRQCRVCLGWIEVHRQEDRADA
jgi:hypothetical protein